MAQRRKEDCPEDDHSVARAKWGDKMVEFIGADMQHLLIVIMIIAGTALAIYDGRERDKDATVQRVENTRQLLAAHSTMQKLLHTTNEVLERGNAEARRQRSNMIYVLSKTPEERKSLQITVPEDFKGYYRK